MRTIKPSDTLLPFWNRRKGIFLRPDAEIKTVFCRNPPAAVILPQPSKVFISVRSFLRAFGKPHRILKSSGHFLIVNEINGKNGKDSKRADIVDGMKIYSADEICCCLKKAGFRKISVFRSETNRRTVFPAVK